MRKPFRAKWVQVSPTIFQWGKRAAYWKGAKGWWASRKDHEGIQGPFRTPGAALRWAEEPFREAHRAALKQAREEAQRERDERKAKRLERKSRATEQAQEREAQALATWNGLPPEDRKVQAGQVWAMRNPRHADHQILVVEVKKRIASVHSRATEATPWKGLRREPRSLGHIPRLYRLVDTVKVPRARRG